MENDETFSIQHRIASTRSLRGEGETAELRRCSTTSTGPATNGLCRFNSRGEFNVLWGAM